jgi:hypothetical protein
MVRIYSDKMQEVVSFSRQKNDNKIIALINFSDKPVTVKLNSKHHAGTYTDWFAGTPYVLKGDDEIKLEGWGYLVLVK